MAETRHLGDTRKGTLGSPFSIFLEYAKPHDNKTYLSYRGYLTMILIE